VFTAQKTAYHLMQNLALMHLTRSAGFDVFFAVVGFIFVLVISLATKLTRASKKLHSWIWRFHLKS